jgi:endonuclease III
MTPSAAGSRSERIVRELLVEHGRTFAEELEIDLREDAPAPWFRLLCFALLCSTRIGTSVAVRAAHDLTAAGWPDPAAMAGATWEDLVRVLDGAGYVRYDFRTASRLELLSRRVRDVYGGDLRRLREVAGRSLDRERKLLEEFVGIGPVGADVFLREAQAAWPELRPYVDARTRETARELGLPADPERLAALVPSADLASLVAALVRHRIAHRHRPVARAS